MYDLSKKFEEFYGKHVVLGSDKQQELRDKKDLNIRRLEEGLELYNEENKKNYKIAEKRVQGSMAMSTVVQNDQNDYDIDVAIVFDKSNLGDLGALQARRLVCKALEKKCQLFKEPPECKTNCVRVKYASGYHVDFAIYRRFKEEGSSEYIYEHAGTEWKSRNPAAITKWFQDEVKNKGTELRKTVRLSKMFCKSRLSWINMPGGLIQSVLCDEVFVKDYDRLDEIFYHTMLAVRDRLQESTDVYNPTDTDLSLLTAKNHYAKMDNWFSRLDTQINKLDVLLDEECTYEQAVEAWGTFFNHDYWNELAEITESVSVSSTIRKALFTNTEEFIEDMVPIDESYDVQITCKVEANGIRKQFLKTFLEQFPQFYNLIPHGLHIFFEAQTDTPYPYDVWWKIRNVGDIAEQKNMIRGQIEKQWGTSKREDSQFGGPHYVECYIIKNGMCVALRRISVPIGEKSI